MKKFLVAFVFAVVTAIGTYLVTGRKKYIMSE